MKKILIREIQTILNKDINEKLRINELNELFKSKAYTILGFDIYKYSKYDTLPQSLIPYIFKKIYDVTIKHCLVSEKFIFQFYKSESDFSDLFIDTGDGGFQIFNNPIEALIFAIYFQTNLKQYNSSNAEVFAEKIIGEITLRYALTTDIIYKIEDKYYGPGIINNARIMSKDKLNRFLVDTSSIKWFDKNTNGVENLQTLILKDFDEIEYFSKYDKKPIVYDSIIFPITKENKKILKIDVLKIDELNAKGDFFSVYGLHIQVFVKTKAKGLNKYIVTLGNLNMSGLIGD